MLVMHVIFQHISISRCGCLSMELEALRRPAVPSRTRFTRVGDLSEGLDRRGPGPGREPVPVGEPRYVAPDGKRP